MTAPYDTLDALALGLPLPAPVQYAAPAAAATPTAPSVAEQALPYALAKQVPDMARGFSIHTSYGDIVVVPGPLADQIQALVRQATERELAACGAQA